MDSASALPPTSPPSGSDAPTINLANQLLVAMPSMADPTFSGTVVYVCEHNAKGALGIVINRPTDLDLATLFEKIDLKLEIQPLSTQPVYFGGPVQTERGFVLHSPMPENQYSSSLTVPGGLAMTTSKDVLEAVAVGEGPAQFLMSLGYSGWSAGQLEDELAQNGWLTVEADTSTMRKIIFDTPVEERLHAALALLGIDLTMLSGEAGHA